MTDFLAKFQREEAPAAPAFELTQPDWRLFVPLSVPEINRRLGFKVGMDFLAGLGFEPDDAGVFIERDWPAMRRAIAAHVAGMT